MRKTTVALLIQLLLLTGCSFQPSPLRIEAVPDEGFQWPYFLLLPELDQPPAGLPLLVVPNNTGKVSDDTDLHLEEAAEDASGASPFGKLALELGVPLLVPGFPRPAQHPHFYTHALDRDCLVRQVDGLERLDLQLLAMIDHARGSLAKKGWELRPEIIITGFSASGMFANRFTLLHPGRVAAAAIGSPGGWPMVPLPRWDGECLAYPAGTCDLESLVGHNLNLEALSRTPLLFFLGSDDRNDSVPYSDSYDEKERGQVLKLSEDLQERWHIAERIYDAAGMDARFKTYPGTGHTLTSEMMTEVGRFFARSVSTISSHSSTFSEHE